MEAGCTPPGPRLTAPRWNCRRFRLRERKAVQAAIRSVGREFGKLTQPLVSTPESVIEVPRQLLDDQGVTTMRDALRNVPGVSLAAGEGGQQGDNLSIRGFNAQNDFYLDGVHDFGSYYRDPFNLQSIEIIQGPASVLFGRGSTGGAVNQVSKQPQIEPVTQGSISLGTDGTKRITTDINRAIEGLDGGAVRLNLMGNINGVSGRDGAKNRRLGFAPEIALGLGTDTRMTLDYFHTQANDTPDYGIPWLNGTPAPVSHKNYYGFSSNDFFRTGVDIFTGKIEHDFNDNITVSNQIRYGSYQRNLHVTEPLILGQGPARGVVAPGVPFGSIVVTRNVIALKSMETILDNQTNANIRFASGPLNHTVTLGTELSRQTSDPTRFTFPQLTTNLADPSNVPPARPARNCLDRCQDATVTISASMLLIPSRLLHSGMFSAAFGLTSSTRGSTKRVPRSPMSAAMTGCPATMQHSSTSRSQMPASITGTALHSIRPVKH